MRRWRSVGQRGRKDEKRGSIPLAGFAELPGATQVYQPASNAWEPRSDDSGPCVLLLGIAGRVGVVHAESEHVTAAFELLLWLPGRLPRLRHGAGKM